MAPDSLRNDLLLNASAFDPVDYFDGRIRADGIFIDRFGKVQRRFAADIHCIAGSNTTRLDEHFIYDNGDEEERVWTLTRDSETDFTGHCDDLIGRAQGRVSGPVFTLSYDFLLPMFGRRVKVHFEDVMVSQTEQLVLNRARVTKFGLLLGELIITFNKLG